jgi:hypothetical protein
MPNIFLYAGETDPHDIKLADPTVARGGSAVSCSVAQTQDEQAQAVAAKETLKGAFSQAQDEQAEAIAGKESFKGSVDSSQDEQAQAIAGKESFAAAVAQVQGEQAQAVAGKETLTCAVAQDQDEQSEAVAGKESFKGAVAQTQNEQAEQLSGKESFSAVVVSEQAEQAEAIEAAKGATDANAAVVQAGAKQAQFIGVDAGGVAVTPSVPGASYGGGFPRVPVRVREESVACVVGQVQAEQRQRSIASAPEVVSDELLTIRAELARLYATLPRGVAGSISQRQRRAGAYGTRRQRQMVSGFVDDAEELLLVMAA